jgi:hypothetical protein
VVTDGNEKVEKAFSSFVHVLGRGKVPYLLLPVEQKMAVDVKIPAKEDHQMVGLDHVVQEKELPQAPALVENLSVVPLYADELSQVKKKVCFLLLHLRNVNDHAYLVHHDGHLEKTECYF